MPDASSPSARPRLMKRPRSAQDHAVSAAARALAARAPRGAWRAAAAALVSLNRSGRRAEAMRAAGSSDRRTCSIDRAATSAGRACAAVAGVAASSGRRRTQAAIASMWNAARRAHGSLLSVPARRNRALALPGVLAAASAVLGDCYSARIWHDGVFRLSANAALVPPGSLSLILLPSSDLSFPKSVSKHSFQNQAF